MRTLTLLLPALLVAACASPREACLRGAGAELATLDRLIAESEAALARGFRLERRAEPQRRMSVCFGTGRWHDGLNVGLSVCPDLETTYREVPVAIDPEAERRKLATLRARRADEARRAQAAATACPPA